jgi:hypothetical protein
MADRDLVEIWVSIEESLQELLDKVTRQIEQTNQRADDFTQLVKAKITAERALALCEDVIRSSGDERRRDDQ